jgi:hypothetical protein
MKKIVAFYILFALCFNAYSQKDNLLDFTRKQTQEGSLNNNSFSESYQGIV